MDRGKKGEATCRRILDTAFSLLSEKGYAAVGMREIAEGAHVALSQLTYHFRSKQGLMSAVIKDTGERYITELDSELAGYETPQRRLKAIADFFEGSVYKNRAFLRIFTDFVAQSMWIPAFKRQINVFFEKMTRTVQRHIFPQSAEGENSAHKAAARLVLAAFYGVSVQISLGGEGAHEIMELARGGLQIGI